MTPRTIRRASSRQLVLSGLAIAAALAGAPQVRAAPDETEAKPTRRANGTRGALGVLADALGLDHEPPRAATPSGSPAEAPNPPLATPAAPPATTPPPAADASGFRGKSIPESLRQAFRRAKRSRWNKNGKCLQFAGTVASKAGATRTTQPHSAYKPAIRSFQGRQINELDQAVASGALKPGMLIHVKIHSERNRAYHTADDAHHWFVYMGQDEGGVPRFADTRGANQSAEGMYRRMKAWKNSRRYGDRKHGYVPTVTAFYDPFASQR